MLPVEERRTASAVLGTFWTLWEPSLGFLGTFGGGALERSLRVLALRPVLGSSWGPLGPSWKPLGPSRRLLG
eukprot:6615485-Pyramimonas_sp.AAC.1